MNKIPHSSRLRPFDVLETSPKDVLWTSRYGPLSNAKRRPLPTSWGRPLPTSLGRWGRPHVKSWGHSQTVLFVSQLDVPANVLRKSPAKFMRISLYGPIFTSKGHVLPMFWGRSSKTSWGRPKNALIWVSK